MRALPLDHSLTSLGSASWRRVGFESGKMMGRSTCLDISVTTSWVKVLGFVEVPIRTCGCTSLITLRRDEWSFPSHSLSSRAYGTCAGVSLSPWLFRRRPGLSTHLIPVVSIRYWMPLIECYQICLVASSLDILLSVAMASRT